MTDDTARADLAAVPDHVWRYQQGSGHLLGCCIHTDAHLTSARPSGLLRERFDHWYLDTDDPKNDLSWVAGWNECLDTVRAALAATEPRLDVQTAADDVRWAGGGGTCEYWRGFNDGIDKLAARLAGREPKGADHGR